MDKSNKKPPPYYAVIFTSQLSQDTTDYDDVAEKMEDLAKQQPGFISVESVRDTSGLGITISYWESLEAIKHWRENAAHTIARQRGREQWYEQFHMKICVVEKEYDFQRKSL
ncbi:antibiotic biosynthesis monooxygenase [Bacillus sp. DX1.1]|uniref:antibiotic biosynthesis monooxygenase family protein n=1 Tax=unclassified Bacillus (in: firmicutes) TaxID=185979 RepID=UPI0025702BF4|nr:MULTISPECIES: antibiotic biosynthesis monooxygenase [unclassified Bacillus (in: firmicutes)]MDM5154269.1 antibiotic biosynthesis monooxygenase [Bacillus sp. DX1.1]WJE83187.1 antibiotic biosynthesis monooxygenase [Bacillus sp. DX3.1]